MIPGTAWRATSRASSDPATSQPRRTLHSCPELASPTWETHLRDLCLRSQCTLTFPSSENIFFTSLMSTVNLIFYSSLHSTLVPCLLKIYGALSRPRTLVPKCGCVSSCHQFNLIFFLNETVNDWIINISVSFCGPPEVDRTNEESSNHCPLHHLQRGEVHWCSQ